MEQLESASGAEAEVLPTSPEPVAAHPCQPERKIGIRIPRWAAPLLEPARYKGIHGGRGGAKSHVVAELQIAKQIADPNRSLVCIREVQKSLKFSVKRLLEQKIRDLEVSDYFDVKSTEIRSRRGTGVILFQGMNDHTADSVKSLEGFDAWAEEAQVLSQRSLDLLRPTIRRPGAELWFTWNPDLETDPVDAFLRGEDPHPDSIVVETNYDDNPWCPQSLIDEAEYDRRTDLEKFDNIWGGKYAKHAQARVFKKWRVEEFEAPAGAFFRLGADFGFGDDPTVLIRCYLDGRKLYIDHEAWSLKCEFDDVPELFLTVPDAEKWPIVADSSAPGLISHLRKRGLNLMPAVKGSGSVAAGVKWLQNYEIIVHPRCEHTIKELRLYSYIVDPLTKQVIPVLKDEDNHVIDALRYACEGVRRMAQASAVGNIVPLPTVARWGGAHG